MNKKLMAIAVAGALSAPGFAMAQMQSAPGVTFYGYIDIGVLNDKFAATTTTPISTTAVGPTTKSTVYAPNNRIGFRGREDLGGGSAAWFQLEAGIHPDGRSDTAVTTGIDFGGRDSGLGLSNPWGDVMAGIWASPYKATLDTTWNVVTSGGFGANGVIMGNGDTTGTSPNANCQSPEISPANGTVNTTTTVCASYAAANGTSFHKRLSNTVQYWSPVMSGFQVKLATQLPTNESNTTTLVGTSGNHQKPELWSGSLTWAHGPVLLDAAYERHTDFRMGTAAGSSGSTQDSAWQIGGKWTIGPVVLGAAYEMLSYGDTAGSSGTPSTKMDQKDYVVNGRWNVGPGALWASYSATPGGTSCTNVAGAVPLTIGNAACGSAGKAKEYGLGYDYVLSKRSKIYIVYNKIDNGAGTNYYYVAGQQANASGGTAQGLVAGTDVTTYGVGMQTVF